MRRILKVIAVLRRHERLVLAAVLGLGVATMVAHWWGTARIPPPPVAPAASRAPVRELPLTEAPPSAPRPTRGRAREGADPLPGPRSRSQSLPALL